MVGDIGNHSGTHSFGKSTCRRSRRHELKCQTTRKNWFCLASTNWMILRALFAGVRPVKSR
jgi:hypothetical protein